MAHQLCGIVASPGEEVLSDGVECSAQGKYNEAEPLYKRAIAIGEKSLDLDHPGLATWLNNLAELFQAQGRHDEAKPLYDHAIEIYEETHGPYHPALAASLNNLALLSKAQGHYDEAKPLYERAIEIKEATLGPDHPELAVSLDNLAALFQAQGRYDEAKPLYERAIEIKETSLGLEHPSLAASLNNVAGLFQAQGHYDEAKPLYERAIEIKEATLGPDHPELATSLNSLAGLLQAQVGEVFIDVVDRSEQGKYDEAVPLCNRAIAIDERSLGPDHPELANSLNNLALLFKAQVKLFSDRENRSPQGKYDEAEPLNKRAIAIGEKSLGPDHPDLATWLSNFAGLLKAQVGRFEATASISAQGKYDEAEPLYKRVIAIEERSLGLDHPELATSLNNFAELLKAQVGTFSASASIVLHRASTTMPNRFTGGISQSARNRSALITLNSQLRSTTSEDCCEPR